MEPFFSAARQLGLALLAAPLFAGVPARGADTPLLLPRVTVSAEVPLAKVAEFRMHERRFAPAAVSHGEFVYIVGGLTRDGTASNTVERFDPRNGRSDIIAKLKQPRFWHRAVIADGKLYVIGGASLGGGVQPGFASELEEAMRLGRRTTRVVETPIAAAGVTLEDTVEIVDLTSGGVHPGPLMPDARHSFACVHVEGRIYVIGGQRDYRGRLARTNRTAILDLASNRWREGAPMPVAIDTDGTVVDGGFIVTAGGYTGLAKKADVNVYDPRADTWRSIAPLCRSTSAHSVVFFGDFLFLFGDYDTPERLLAYDLRTKESEVFTLGYTAARHTAAVLHDGRIYVIGGREVRDAEPLDLIQVFAPTKHATARP